MGRIIDFITQVNKIPEIETNLNSVNDISNPIGTIIIRPDNWSHDKYLKCDGSSLLKSDYPNLYDAIGDTYGSEDDDHFNIPDLRGVFIRGLDEGRDLDSDRELGSYQDDDFAEHNHTGTTSSDGSHDHGGDTSSDGSHTHDTSIDIYNKDDGNTVNGVASADAEGDKLSINSAGDHTHTIDSDGDHSHNLNIDNTGGDETRPKNVAMIYYIRSL